MAFVVLTRFSLASHPDQLVIVVVELVGQMGTRASRHTARDRAAVYDRDLAASEQQLIRTRQTCNSRADHEHIGTGILAERRRNGGGQLGPQWPSLFGRHVHEALDTRTYIDQPHAD